MNQSHVTITNPDGTTEYLPITITVNRKMNYCMSICFCGRVFKGRDYKRVDQHHNKHAKRCTRARKHKRWMRTQPKVETWAMPPGEQPVNFLTFNER